jgi:sulfatase maturation enzyme AslB (radical SAM superfamily)
MVLMTKTEAKKILTVGNFKLGNVIATFDLPATKEVCNRICNGCYAIKAQNQYPDVLPSRERKLELSKTESFEATMVDAITAINPVYVRAHSSGEMYSQDYINKWERIAKQLPNQKFYAYTKRLKDFDFTKLKSRPNFVVIDSMFANQINFGKLENKPNGMFLCPDHKGSVERIAQPKGPICGISCTYCMDKQAETTGVWFVQH